MYLGYNTNGFAHHAIEDTLELLAEIGYQGVALTIDHHLLNPFDADYDRHVANVSKQLERLGLRTVIETGARYLLDPRRKHFPTLLSRDEADRQRRVESLKQAIDLARRLNSDCVSLWSGTCEAHPEEISHAELTWQHLTQALQQVMDYAESRNVTLGFEPEPGMWVDTMVQYDALQRRLRRPELLRLTLDIGHLQCQGELPLADYITRYAKQLVNVHLEDMRRGVHEHLMFGEGEIDFVSVLRTLRDHDYQGGVFVELSRHSHLAPEAAQRSFEFLQPLMTP